MSDRRGRPALPPPTDLSTVYWTENARQWHAITQASANRWGRTLCGSTAGGIYEVPADEYPEGPAWPGIMPSHVCGKCLERVDRLRQP